MSEFEKFQPRPGVSLAFHRFDGASKTLPGVVFMHGFMSDMTGGKAIFLEDRCRHRNQSFVRFDCTGHGQSSGKFEDGTIGSWLQDALDIIDRQTQGPQIFVGSSMGGWIALLAALARPDRLAGVMGIAPAPDFTEDVYNHEFKEEERRHLATKGIVYRDNPYGAPYPLTRELFRDGKNHIILNRPIAIRCPVRLVQGKMDEVVPWEKSERIREKLLSNDVKIVYIDNGDHRLSNPSDLQTLDDTLVELSHLHQLKLAV